MRITRKAIAIIGEGITEKYYIESIKGLTNFQIYPKELQKKASSLKKLEESIKAAIKKGYDEVYCLIDMDGKEEEKPLMQYSKLKKEFHQKTHVIKSQGIECRVIFIETERCTELWFLYHFTKNAITRKFNSYNELEKELKKYLPNYEKTEKYFKSISSLHKELTKEVKPSGSLSQAISNADSSVVTRNKDGRNHTYCEMHILIHSLGIVP